MDDTVTNLFLNSKYNPSWPLFKRSEIVHITQESFSQLQFFPCLTMESEGGLSFALQSSSLVMKISQRRRQEEEEEAPHKRPKHDPDLVQLCFNFRVHRLTKLRARLLDGQMVKIRDTVSPVITRSFLKTSSNLINSPALLQDFVTCMLSELGFKFDTSHNLVKKISSYALDMANNIGDNNVGLKVLPIQIEMGTVDYFVYDEREAMEVMLGESMLENWRRGYGVVPADKTAIDELEKVQFRCEDSMITKCTICLDEFELGSKLAHLPCRHCYHQHCISRWLENSHVCPICRFELPIKTE